MGLRPETVELLKRVKEHILEEPRRLDMGLWATKRLGPECETAACVAGWMKLLSTPVANRTSTRDTIEMTLSFGAHMGVQHGLPKHGETLFHTERWPESFRAKFNRTLDAAEEARITAARIDHYIATDGEE